MSREAKAKIAFWFRYSPADHAELYPAMPPLVETLARTCEVHYFAARSRKPVPDKIRSNSILHLAPFSVDRSSSTDKAIKLVIWYLCLPFIALRCRFLGVRLVCINDYQPGAGAIALVLYGGIVISWVADFLHNVYAQSHPFFRPAARMINSMDFWAWRRCPLIFTMVEHTRAFLASHGIDPNRVHPIHDSCDVSVYRPLPRSGIERKWGLKEEDVVLCHHGILHPNKGLARILSWLPPIVREHSDFRFLIIGSGPEEKALRKVVSDLKISKAVIFTGWLPSAEDVNRAINMANMSLVMRAGDESDNFHATSALTHSMCAGQPILAARLGGISEIVTENHNGYLFDPHNGDEFRTKLSWLIADAKKRKCFGAASRALATDLFSIDSVVERTAGPILSLLDSDQTGRCFSA